MRSRFLRFLQAGTVVCTAIGCATQAAGISDDVVKIGVLSDMSGLYADTAGRGSVEAARMAIQDFGGTVLGKKIELVFADHQNKADVGATAARNWFDREGVDLIVDLNNSSVAVAVNNLARERNKMVMNTGGASDILTNEHCAATAIHYTYDSYALGNSAVRGILAQGKKDWYIIGVDYAFGKAMTANLNEFVGEGGGRIVGATYHPLNASDFSSFLLQAQSSKASVIALANATADTVNTIKAANEFGITKKQTVVPTIMFINDVHALGLKQGQGMVFATGFYWDRTPESRQWARRFFEKMKKMPSMVHAGGYSAVTQYLKAVQATGTDDGLAVAKQLKSMPITDFFSQNGKVREDGRMVHDMYLVEVKKPEESQYPWDYYKVLKTIPGDQAFKPLVKSTCKLLKG
ncbi:ABC transporter substrate-binding protein [Diaphorobacter sp. HDW4A]|uniref:ABC transporter substrate-binding protein n=1 Tax=Diaphorobacter sp. HDW4A TaxID=2714924 RepID=UPI0014099E90|nr:ABC transporter substrate-binding protein [Diaphorobacter sp. HDW4A]QIL80261.1 ABC transporter substrate-binding protein [Diaphorobacter sp. HDW4A]